MQTQDSAPFFMPDTLKDKPSHMLKPWDMFVFTGVIILLNGHLLGAWGIDTFLFLPRAVIAGQWWRILTHPFIHVSWYHLSLDAGAFLLLYSGLKSQTIPGRLIHVAICGSSSLTAAWAFSPVINTTGLCGLSGIAHGLMIITSLEMMQSPKSFRSGMICLTLIVSKSIFEFISGDVFFSFLHFGRCGTPLVACHLGGVVGGMMSYFLSNCDELVKNRQMVNGA
ncbi:MAG: rhombosortase [Proteobacteria bacterium]|nr:rhombosortase [Pseudomonadota bacterium]